MKIKPFITMAVMAMLCAIGINAQQPGPGVDPNATILEDFETGTTGHWSIRPGTRGEKMTSTVLDATKGDMVKVGKHAVRLDINFLDAQAQQTLTAQFSPGKSGEDLQIPGNDKGGKRLGMWVYASAGVQGMWVRCSTRPIGATSGVTNTDFAQNINWTGWKYLQCNLPKGHEFHPDGIRLLVLKSFSNYFVNGYVIIDNIRVTNQSFNEDLEAPSVTSFTANETAISGTFNTSKINFAAKYAENGASGINNNSIKFVIDGEVYTTGSEGFAIDEANGTATLTGKKFANGAHTAEIIVEDNFGNIGSSTGSFSVDATDGGNVTVELASKGNPSVGTPYVLDINTNDAKGIKELQFVLNINNIGGIAESEAVKFAQSATEGSNYSYDKSSGNLTVNIKNDIATATSTTLASVNVEISKYSYPTDILRISPVSAKAVYADGSSSSFTLFEAFEKPVISEYDFKVVSRVVGLPGAIKVIDKAGNPVSGATVYALDSEFASTIATGTTGADGIASDMPFTSTAQGVNIYAEKEGKYSYTSLVRTLQALLTATPEYIRAGSTPDPLTMKTFTWMANPVLSADKAIIKIATKNDGESAFTQHEGKTRFIEYNAVVSNGATRGFSATVTGLTPDTEYIYQVGDGTNWSTTRQFRTAKVTDKYTFAAFGDLQASSNGEMSRFIAAGKTMESLPETPMFSLNVGDVVDSDDRFDCYSYYGYLVNECPGFAGIDMVSAYGNHEYMGNADADNIKFINGHHHADDPAVGTGTYYVEYGNAIVVSLDWEHRGGDTPKNILAAYAKWMDKVFTQFADKTWKFVTLHYPIFPNESTPGSKQILGPVFDKHGVQMVFCGHGHTYERVQVKNGEYLVPTSDRRTFTPVIGGTIHMQLGDMTRTGASGRWFLCKVNGKEMRVDIYDANNKVVENESFTLYAAPLGEFTVNFGTTTPEGGTLEAECGGKAITSGQKVKENSNVTFTAKPQDGFKVKHWIVDNSPVEDTNTTFTLQSIKADTDVKVVFGKESGIESTQEITVTVSPNPTASTATLTGAEGADLRISNLAGLTVMQLKVESDRQQIDMQHLPSGMYFFNIANNGYQNTIKVIKK